MELHLPQDANGGVVSLSRIFTTHGKETITWDASKFIKTKIRNPNGFFAPLNRYIQTLSGDQQDALFNCYKSIYEAFEQMGGGHLRMRKIHQGVKQLYRIIPWGDFSKWCHANGVVLVPADVPPSFEQTRQHGATLEKTYDQPQYWDLAVLSLYLKFSLPAVAWGMAESDAKVGTTLKELKTFHIFKESCVPKLNPVERLRVYIAAHLDRYSMPISAVLGCLSSAELPAHFLSRTLIRKVMLCENDDNVIKMVHSFIIQQLDAMDKGNGFEGAVREKNNRGGKSEEDNASVAENYKVRQMISDGDLETLVYYSQQLKTMALKVDHTIDPSLLDTCLDNLNNRPLVPSEIHQKTLAQWVLGSSMSARGMASLNRASLLRDIAVAQALLWHWGFHEIALLMTVERSREQSIGFVPKTRTNLSPTWHHEFAKRYPLYQEPTTRSRDVRHQNVAYMAIEGPNTNNPNRVGLASLILQSEWIVHGPQALVDQIDGVANGEYWVAPPDIRNQLAKLICHLFDLKYGTPQ